MKRPGTLFLVRHGESGWNRERLIQGQSRAAPGLTTAGRADAAAAASNLADSGAAFILASDLRRAAETARPIAARLGVPIWFEPRLRERRLGVAEGRPSDQIGPGDLGVTGRRVTDPDAWPPGGESVRQLYERITSLLSELLSSSPDRRIILVTHGGPIRVACAYRAGLGVGEMTWPAVPNGSIVEVPGPEAGSPECTRPGQSGRRAPVSADRTGLLG
jgi:2,3-bisphosphoglycerate-dependent phosphoglycerate mutase